MSDSIQHTIQVSFEHRIFFTRDVFGEANGLLTDLLSSEQRPVSVIVAYDDGLLKVRPELPVQIMAWFKQQEAIAKLATAPLAIPGGERCKNDWQQVEQLWEVMHQTRLCRHSVVIAIGGGAVLDLVGFAAATAHRGIRLIRLPTTSLAQGDGGVGVKNAVNFFGKKNWIGTFAVPAAVVNDSDFLRLLPPEEVRAGLVEALKVALIRDAGLYWQMDADRQPLAALEPTAVDAALQASAALHARHIATSGDPFERGSARPLDFGHWIAHKLEQLSDFTVGHGAAVSVGMAVDILYASRSGLLDSDEADQILDLMRALQFPLYHPLLEAETAPGQRAVLAGLEEFREHLGGELTITLPRAVGEGVDVHEMDPALIRTCIAELRQSGGGFPIP